MPDPTALPSPADIVPPDDGADAFVLGPVLLVEGAPGGPLSGRSLVVKDLFDVAGTVTGAGNPDFADGRAPATATAPAVARLVAAGATVVGKTITDELAYSLAGTNVHHGTPRNHRAPDRAPGGSSSGSVAAVAAGAADLGLGTDTGGSIRVPASACGVFGWRPTHGAVDATGLVALSPSFDTVGLLARDPVLLAAAAGVLLDEAPDDAEVGDVVLWADPFEVVEPDVGAALGEAARRLVTGAEERCGLDLEEARAAFVALQGAEAWATHGQWIRRRRPTFGPGVAARFAAAEQVDDAAVTAALEVRARVRAAVLDATAGGRVLLAPAAPGPSPLLGEPPDVAAPRRAATLRLTSAAGLAGAPVVVLPGVDVDGAPVGLAAVGAPGTDRALLAWAATVADEVPAA